jgi:hypothetical protein
MIQFIIYAVMVRWLPATVESWREVYHGFSLDPGDDGAPA